MYTSAYLNINRYIYIYVYIYIYICTDPTEAHPAKLGIPKPPLNTKSSKPETLKP